VFDSASVKAEDTTNHPYYIRPDDFSAAGVWVEDVGADQPQAWNGGQLRTGAILSNNWVDGTSGMKIDLDNEQLCFKDSTFGDPGIQLGWFSAAYKFHVGDANSFFKWDGGAWSVQMASGETFNLYGGITVKNGADIRLDQGGTIYSISTSSESPGFMLTDDFDTPTWINKIYQIASGQFYIDTNAASINIRNYTNVNNLSQLVFDNTLYENWSLKSVNAGRYVEIAGITQTNYELIELYESNTGATLQIGYNGITLNPGTSNIVTIVSTASIGLGTSAGRIEFDNQSPDEINFLSCVVGIGTSTPSAYADLTLEGGALCLKECTTPTANADYGKIYTKNDNKLYFQDGAGDEHEIQFA